MRLLILILVFLSGNLLMAQTKSVSLNTAGTLQNQISVSERTSISTLSVSGNIDARDFQFLRDEMKVLSVLNLSGAIIKTYTGTNGTITDSLVTYPANGIPDHAFYNRAKHTYKSTLTSIMMPSGLTDIGKLAFYFNWNLSGTLTFPASLKNIGNYAFYGCYNISTFSISSNNTRYSTSNGVIYNKLQDTLFLCPNAKTGNYTTLTTTKHIAASAFENCYKLTDVTLSANIQSIGNYAFSYCSGIAGDLTLPAGLTKMGEGCFYHCDKLTGSVNIPATLTNWGNYCFLHCDNITSFSVNTSNPLYTSANGSVFSKNMDSLFICPPAYSGNYNIPATVRLIGSHAFYNCGKITGTLNIPAQVEYIGYYAFYGCKLLANFTVDATNNVFTADNGVLITKDRKRLVNCPPLLSGNYQMPNELTSIDPAAFNNCTALTGYLKIPANTTSIGGFAFYNCTGISGFEVDAANTRYSAADGVLFSGLGDTLLVFPLSKAGTYNIPNTVKVVGPFAFDGIEAMTSITIPESVIEIGNYAFEYCTGLTEINLPYSVDSIGPGAFYNCTGLKKLTVANEIPPIVDYYSLEAIDKNSCSLIVPTAAKVNYAKAPYWESFKNISEQSLFLDIKNPVNNKLKAYSSNQTIHLQGLTKGNNIELMDMNGRIRGKFISDDPMMSIPFPHRGFLMIKSGDETTKIIVK